jgi:hypothetical protein
MIKTKYRMIAPLAVLIVLSVVCVGWITMRINSDFATKVLLEYHYADKNISMEITDENDIFTLKQMLRGYSFKDNPSCGFTTDISINMTNDKKSVVFCPALDGCPLLRINDSNVYIKVSDDVRKELDAILSKYDMAFPCI